MAQVSYVCGCGRAQESTMLYWCRHCATLRCVHCVAHEVLRAMQVHPVLTLRHQVDSYFCPHCLDEHMPSTEVKLNRQRYGGATDNT